MAPSTVQIHMRRELGRSSTHSACATVTRCESGRFAATAYPELMPSLEPRALTAVERATLDLLLEAAAADLHALRDQADQARVVGSCDCGCATIDVAIGPDVMSRTEAHGRIAASASSRPGSPQHPAELLLHVVDGILAEVEIVDDSGQNRQATFPPIETWETPRAGIGEQA